MTPAEIQAAYAGLDLLLTGAARVAQMIREANNQNPVLAPEQEARLAAIENERAATGLPPTEVMGGPAEPTDMSGDPEFTSDPPGEPGAD